jgi:hypothetical protein
MNVPARFLPHTVSVRDLVAGGGMGGGHATPRDVPSWVVDEQKVVRDPNGEEVVSSTQVSVDIDETIPIGSLVTVWVGDPSEREAKVIAITTLRHDRLPSHHVLHLI